MTGLSSLKPENLWRHFDKILSIPHGSGDEKALAEWLADWGTGAGFEVRRDDAGNVVIRKDGTEGSNSECVVLQAHIDMVCEKNATMVHDFTKDPIVPVIFGNILKASGTTLGADNGIGVAAALAILEEPGLEHPPIEVLLTIEEETGLTGAAALKKWFVTGKTLLNLDSEEEGVFYIGCAGGQDTKTILRLERDNAESNTEKTGAGPGDIAKIKVMVEGLAGGHSGCNIHEHRGNALKILSATLADLMETFEVRLIYFQGGNKDNAIPREASAMVALRKCQADKFAAAVSERAARVATELPPCDSNFTMTAKSLGPVAPGDPKDAAAPLTTGSTIRFLSLLAAFPDGVANMSNDMPGLVETSCNLAIVRTTETEASIICSLRSSISAGIENLISEIRALVRLAGANLVLDHGYPGWRPNPSSSILETTIATYRETFGISPEVKAIHAGLECGIIGECLGGMDMLSFGPTIKNPHCPDELVEIDSVAKFYDFLKNLLKRLAESK